MADPQVLSNLRRKRDEIENAIASIDPSLTTPGATYPVLCSRLTNESLSI